MGFPPWGFLIAGGAPRKGGSRGGNQGGGARHALCRHRPQPTGRAGGEASGANASPVTPARRSGLTRRRRRARRAASTSTTTHRRQSNPRRCVPLQDRRGVALAETCFVVGPRAARRRPGRPGAGSASLALNEALGRSRRGAAAARRVPASSPLLPAVPGQIAIQHSQLDALVQMIRPQRRAFLMLSNTAEKDLAKAGETRCVLFTREELGAVNGEAFRATAVAIRQRERERL